MRMTRFRVAIVAMLALGLNAEPSRAEQYDPPVTIATLACPAGSSGYGNGRFLVFPSWASSPPNWRLTIWCSAGGSGRRSHYEPGAGGVFTGWTGLGGAIGIGWPPPASYTNQYQMIDIDNDGDLDVLHIVETAPDTWSVLLSRML
jgi:hypothetical protein